MDEKLKIAVIGCGGISGVHLPAYAKNPNVEIYALCDINEKNLNHRGDEYNVDPARRFLNVNDMLAACPEIDAVSVCTWNAAHAECTIAALNAGKHVLCEKPMAMNAQEAEAMADAARRNNKVLMIGFVRRFGNDCALLKDFIDNDQFGEIYYAKTTYLRRKGFPGGWFGDKARSGGGKRPGFEGGQMPLTMRLPKRGFTNKWRTEYVAINVDRLEIFEDGQVVTPVELIEMGIIKKIEDGVKIMGNGELTKKLTVQANKFTASAKEKIEAVGGKAEVI